MDRFRNQYILTKKRINKEKGWCEFNVGEFVLYSHPKLEVNRCSNSELELILIGDAFDALNCTYSNEGILKSIISECYSLLEVLNRFDEYSGTFIVLHYNKPTNELIVFNDASALREIYHYNDRENGLVLGSQTKIINTYFDIELDQSKKALEFYSSPSFKKRRCYVGDLTEFKKIKHLKPNHYLNLNKGTIHRFYPNSIKTVMNFEEAAQQSAKLIRGYLEASSNRYNLLLPVSAGWESRVLLAASKNIQKKCHFYVFKGKNYSDDHFDIKTPVKLLKNLNLELNVVQKDEEIATEYIPLIEESVAFPRYESLNYILGYWSSFPNHLSVIGNVSEIARTNWPNFFRLNPKKISIIQEFPFLKYATDYYERWLKDAKKICNDMNFRLLDLLYWEENCGNWVAKASTETRMGIEHFLPFNSRKLLRIMLSVNCKYRQKHDSKLYLRIIEILWSDCLSEPINPNRKRRIIAFLQKVGFYIFYRNFYMFLQLSFYRSKRVIEFTLKLLSPFHF